jgi:hypothetical protein
MRRILVDHARGHQAAKRGGGQYSLSLSRADRIAGQPNDSGTLPAYQRTVPLRP